MRGRSSLLLGLLALAGAVAWVAIRRRDQEAAAAVTNQPLQVHSDLGLPPVPVWTALPDELLVPSFPPLPPIQATASFRPSGAVRVTQVMPAPRPAHRRRRVFARAHVPVRSILVTLVVVGLIGSVAGYGSYSAFTATTTNSGNSFAAGTVAIGDNDAGTAMLSLSNARPGGSDTSCTKVQYTGSLSSTVRLYASVSGTLASYLTVTVTRGTDSSPSFDSCAGFTADATDYNGNGAGVIYSGTLADFPTSYAAGIVDPKAASPESWTTNEEHSYKFTVSLQDNNAAQGLSASAGFTWEARNE